MARIIFEAGDIFSYGGGFGLVLPDGKALCVDRTASRNLVVSVGEIPNGSTLPYSMPSEVKLVSDAITCVLKAQEEKAQKEEY